MADGERQPEVISPYRVERPLSDLIPPDRRRFHSVLLVAASVFTGAMLLLLGEQIYSAMALRRSVARTSRVAPPPVKAAIFSASVAAKYAWADRVSAVDGAPAPDGKVDPRIDVYLEGRFVALMLVPVGPNKHRGGRPWDTIVEDDPLPSGVSGGFERGSASWQLGVFDGEADRSLQRPDGSLVPLGEGRRLVHLYASDDGTIEDGTILRVVGELADGSIVEGPVFALRDVPPDGVLPNVGSAESPFDRGAAAAALGAIDVGSCYAPDGPTGPGHIRVTFDPSGKVSTALVDTPPFTKTPTGNCIATKFSQAKVPAFSGSPVRVGKSFALAGR